MRRAPIATLLCMLPAALSCAVLSAPTPGLAPEVAVAAPAPGSGPGDAVAAAPAPLERERAEASPAAADAARVQQVRRFLARRHTALTSREVDRLAHVIVRESRRHELDPWLVLSVMAVESGFHNFAVSHVGALGLMQVMPATGEELAGRLGVPWNGPHTLFDPSANVRLGVAYLREMTDRYGMLPVALAAYNWGPGRIDRKLRSGVPVPEEYARLVLASYGIHRRS